MLVEGNVRQAEKEVTGIEVRCFEMYVTKVRLSSYYNLSLDFVSADYYCAATRSFRSVQRPLWTDAYASRLVDLNNKEVRYPILLRFGWPILIAS